MAPVTVFVDYDGTITDLDTFDVLVKHVAGAAAWGSLEAQLASGDLTLRAVLERQAAYLNISLADADAYLKRTVRFDPAFAPFVHDCRARKIPVTVVSSGIEPLIRCALARNGLADVPLIANAVDPRPDGWRIRFRDSGANGTDKARLVRAAHAGGSRTVFIGDGHSDFDAALAADDRFAKRGRALERFLTGRRIAVTPFASFAENTLPEVPGR